MADSTIATSRAEPSLYDLAVRLARLEVALDAGRLDVANLRADLRTLDAMLEQTKDRLRAGIEALDRMVEQKFDSLCADLDGLNARFERRFDTLLGRIEIQSEHVEYIRGRLQHVPTTWAMITAIVGGQVALAGLLLAAFRMVGPRG